MSSRTTAWPTHDQQRPLRTDAQGRAPPRAQRAALPASAQDDARPAWCSYPDSAGAAALMDEVDKHVDTISKYSPGQPVDRFTLQLDLMTQCATDGDVAR